MSRQMLRSELTIVSRLLVFTVFCLLTFNLRLTCGYAVPPLCDRSWVRPPCWRCGRDIVRSEDCFSASICYDGKVVNEVTCTGGTVYSMQARTCISPTNKRWYDCGKTLPRKPLDYSTHRPTHAPTPWPTHAPTHKPTLWPTHKPTHKPTLWPTHKPTHKPTLWPTQQPSHTWKPWGPVTSKPTTSKPTTSKATTSQPPTPTTRTTTTRSTTMGPALSNRCGIKIEPFIVGGELSDEGEWPWQLSINKYYSNTDSYRHGCGGALLNDQWMLTAAHCVGSEEFQYNIIVNAYNLFLTSGKEITVGVSKIIRHPDFVENSVVFNYPNDIALVKFADKVELDLVTPICLPPTEMTFSNDDDCWVAGWGDTRGTGARQVLNDLKVEFTNMSACRQAWGEDLILSTHMCVGDGYEGACPGDSGGPLMCMKNGRFYAAGVTSWGHASCRIRGFPNVYTRTSDFTEWIIETIESN